MDHMRRVAGIDADGLWSLLIHQLSRILKRVVLAIEVCVDLLLEFRQLASN